MKKEIDYDDYLKYKDMMRKHNNKYFGDHLSERFRKPILTFDEWKEQNKKEKKTK